MFYLNGNKYFDSMTEAKMSLLHHLSIGSGKYPALSDRLKKSIENHENIKVLMDEIGPQLADIAASDKKIPQLLNEDIESIKRSVFNILPIEVMNRNPIISAVDTFLPAQLLLNPTPNMTAVNKKISLLLASTLREYQKSNFLLGNTSYRSSFELFALQMIFEPSNTYPGTFKLEDVNDKIKQLNKNGGAQISQIDLAVKGLKLTDDQINLIVTMAIEKLEARDTKLLEVIAIHCSYGYRLLKPVPMILPIPTFNDPQNKDMDDTMRKVLTEYQKTKPGAASLEVFYMHIRSPGFAFSADRSFISDAMMYDTDLYKAESSRGRLPGDLPNNKSTLGVIRGNQPMFLTGIEITKPTFVSFSKKPAALTWEDWTETRFDKNSKIVAQMVLNESPFISSYSGTTSLLSSLMIQTNALESMEEKKIYVQSMLAYISGVGFHSVFEVLAPLAYCLEIVPPDKYPVKPALTHEKGPPPLNGDFYEMLKANDPGFSSRWNKSWDQLASWYANTYVKNYELFLRSENVTNLSRMMNIVNLYKDADASDKPILASLLKEIFIHELTDQTSIVQQTFIKAKPDDDLLKVLNEVRFAHEPGQAKEPEQAHEYRRYH